MTDTARTAVLDQLTDAYERLAEHEQRARTIDFELAEEVHGQAVRVLRAMAAEEHDPPTRELPIHCLQCAAGYAAGGSS
jgi:hypothetical protein